MLGCHVCGDWESSRPLENERGGAACLLMLQMKI